MPKAPAKKKPAVPPAVLAPPPIVATPTEAKPIEEPFYKKLTILEYSTATKDGPMTVTEAKDALDWETEKEFQQRRAKETPDSKPEHFLFGDDFHCLNSAGEKVRCFRNGNNRPFDMSWCGDLIHTILNGQWAGPLTVPGETINGETVRISKYRRVLSGQHQLSALILADEVLQKARATGNGEKYPFWVGKDSCCIETIVITGLSEDERVLRTIDYVKPRTTADMLYTMELFRSNTPAERKEMTRMLSAAIDFLWVRTDTQGYKTHPEVVGFLERHRRLLKCVEHLFKENSGKGVDNARKISKLRISAGQASAICYLMGCAGPKTDGDEYRNESPPCEKGLDWSYFDKAKEFWSMLAGDTMFTPVRTAIGRLFMDDEDNEESLGLGGRLSERLAIIALAWDAFKDAPDEAGPPFTDADLADDGLLCLHYSDLDDKGNKLPDGKIKLVEIADFFGIDCPEVIVKKPGKSTPPMPPPPKPDQIALSAEEQLRLRSEADARRKK